MRLALLLGCLLLAPPMHAAEILLVNGRLWTGDERQPQASAIAVRDGRIVAVGDDAVVAATVSETAVRIDLGGRRVVPGINDAHVHLGTSPPSTQLDLPFPESTSDQLVAALQAQPADGEGWITGDIGGAIWTDPGWHQARLDALHPTRPVQLQMFTGHGLLLNSVAQRELGLDPAIAVPGGWYGKGADGAFDGRVYEYAHWRILAQLPPHPDAEELQSIQRYSQATLKWGTTTLQVMPWMPPERFVGLWIDAGARSRLRLIRFPTPASHDEPVVTDTLVKHPADAPRITVSGTKWIIDGTPVDQAAPLRAPYPDTGGNGRLNFDQAQIEALLREILARGDQVLLHVGGDVAAIAIMDAMEAIAPPAQWREHRLRFEHGDGLTPDLLARAASFGIVVVQNPSHFAVPEAHPFSALVRARGFSPLSGLLDAGLPLALGSDGPPNPWLNLMFATTPSTRPDQALTREQALRAYTRGSAYAESTEHEKGKLVAGYLADFAVLSQDVLDPELPAQALPGTRSLLTVIDGEIAWRDPEF
ncbi:amidohydrolase [Luteimonas saliphila]|uniref:amidohydrolase n=1 Tax=Luteimonas saliphila TaxID=2804919 RepID=UPI00192DE398|nr:amidohydrolase family protein [Luteimonas saliphila]